MATSSFKSSFVVSNGHFQSTDSSHSEGFAMPALPNHVLTHINSEPVPNQPIVRLSAFRVPTSVLGSKSQWTRNVDTVSCSFIRSTTTYTPDDGLQVMFKESTSPEDIDIASAYLTASDNGFLGEGFTKRGIYVSDTICRL